MAIRPTPWWGLVYLFKVDYIFLFDNSIGIVDKENAQMIIQCLQQLAAQLDVIMLIIYHDRGLVGTHAIEKYFIMKHEADGTRDIKKI